MQNKYKTLDIELSLGVIKMYLDGESMQDIEERMGIGHTTVSKLLDYHNIPRRNCNDLTQKEMDESFFERIDTEEKAYFLGWMYSDGNIDKDLRSAKIAILKKDGYILDRLNKMFSKESFCHEYRKYYCLSINRRKICEDLVRLGCIPNKSLVLKFPTEEQVPKNLLPHFARGYSDGDGSFIIGSSGFYAKICSSKDFCDGLEEYLTSLDSGLKMTKEVINDKGTTVLKCNGLNPIRLGDILYKNATIALDRKYVKFKTMIKMQSQKVYPKGRDWIKERNKDVLERIVPFYLACDKTFSQ